MAHWEVQKGQMVKRSQHRSMYLDLTMIQCKHLKLHCSASTFRVPRCVCFVPCHLPRDGGNPAVPCHTTCRLSAAPSASTLTRECATSSKPAMKLSASFGSTRSNSWSFSHSPAYPKSHSITLPYLIENQTQNYTKQVRTLYKTTLVVRCTWYILIY